MGDNRTPFFVRSSTLRGVICISALSLVGVAFQSQLEDWENPSVYARNQVAAHTPLVPYDTIQAALRVRMAGSPYFKSLNGTWKFYWSENPAGAPKRFFETNYDTSTWHDIPVPSNWEMEGYGHPMFRNTSHTFAAKPPYVPHDYNPVGSYRRTFTLPSEWNGRQIFLHFDGVKSASTVWLNGKEAGYNEGGTEPAEYNITRLVQPGENTIAVRVLSYSDATYLECQDMWRLSGIHRGVYVFSTPRIHIRDFYVTTDLDREYRNATLRVSAEIENHFDEARQGYGLEINLFDEAGRQALPQAITARGLALDAHQVVQLAFDQQVKNPSKWSAEHPNLYTMTISLTGPNGQPTEVLSAKIGFRKVEIKDQAILINGVPVKFNGVNRHEYDPDHGRVVGADLSAKDIVLMKQFNINAVRTSHYPPDPSFLDLADQYGMYVIDEAGDEAHATRNLSENPTWQAAYLDRARRMVKRDRNHPSVVMWSAGNESGPGQNIAALIAEGKKLDPSRPGWMYGDISLAPDQPFEDIVGPRYPHPSLLEQFGQVPAEKDPRPSFMDEYAAATGNSLGHFDEFWDLIYRYRRLTGGAVWDWVSPGIKRNWIETLDASEQRNEVALFGRPVLVEGRFGKALALSGHDDWVEVYRSPNLDITGDKLTLEGWVYPRGWNGDGSFITKGSRQYGLIQKDEKNLEFYLHAGAGASVQAPVPENWNHQWHHLAGIYDGATLKLYIDRTLAATAGHSGRIGAGSYPVCIGKDAEKHGQDHPGQLCNAIIDEIRIYPRALSRSELTDEWAALEEQRVRGKDKAGWVTGHSGLRTQGASLHLRFDEIEAKGDFFSLGIGARPYGLVWPDRKVQPELWQLKKTTQPVRAELVDVAAGAVRISNRYNFTNLRDLNCTWKLLADDRTLQVGTLKLDIPPSEDSVVKLPVLRPDLKPGAEYRLLFSFTLPDATPWASKGHEVAWEQLEVPFESSPPPIVSIEGMPALELQEDTKSIQISGQDFVYVFDKAQGVLSAMRYKGQDLVKAGPRLNFWRAPLSNETDHWRNPPIADTWYATGLDILEHQIRNVRTERIGPSEFRITINTLVQGSGKALGFRGDYVYRIVGSGDIIIETHVEPQGKIPDWLPNVPMWLPKIGLQMTLPARFRHFSWYGRGPMETYPDRKTGAKIGVYSGTVEEQYSPYLVPQDYGNKTDVRWATLTDESRNGLFVAGATPLNVSAQHFSTDNLTRARYPFQLKGQDSVTLNIDCRVTGVGDTPVPTLLGYRVPLQACHFAVVLRPFSARQHSPMELSRRRMQ